MIGAPNIQEAEATTHGTATVTNVTPENVPNLLDNPVAGGTLNPGAPGRRDPGTLQELRSAGVSGADNGALQEPGADARTSELGPGAPELEMVKDESIKDETEQTDTRSLPYFDRDELDRAMNNKRSLSLYLIRLAALFPETVGVDQLSQKIYRLLDDSGVGAAGVVCIFRGRLVNKSTQLSDLRAILTGHAIVMKQRTGIQKHTVRGGFTVEQMRIIGRMLPSNIPMTQIAKAAGCGRDLVIETERVLQIRSAFREAMWQSAVEAVAAGVSIRAFAKQHGITKSRSERMLNRAKCLHMEKEAAQCLLRQDQNQ